MTVPLDRDDRRVLFLSAGVLVLVTVAAFFVPNGESAPSGFPSSYSPARNGAKAAYTLLEETGYRVERWTRPPGDLPAPSTPTLFIIAGPFLPASTEEQLQLRQFVSAGGRLLLTGRLSAGLLGEEGVEWTDDAGRGWQTLRAEQPAPLTRQAPEIQMESSVRWVHPPSGQQRYYGSREGGAVVKFPLGKGEVIWWAGNSPLTNAGITRASNLALFLNSVGPPGGTRILWDEYYHGVRLGLWHYLGRTPLPWALLQLLLLAAFVVLTYARRSGVLRPMNREPRQSPLEFVTTLGALYQRRGEASGALAIAFAHFRFLLSRRLGLVSTAATADLVRRVEERPGWSAPGLAATVAQIETALKEEKVKEAQALAWIGELHGFAARLGL
jgi:hypothetical protein